MLTPMWCINAYGWSKSPVVALLALSIHAEIYVYPFPVCFEFSYKAMPGPRRRDRNPIYPLSIQGPSHTETTFEVMSDKKAGKLIKNIPKVIKHYENIARRYCFWNSTIRNLKASKRSLSVSLLLHIVSSQAIPCPHGSRNWQRSGWLPTIQYPFKKKKLLKRGKIYISHPSGIGL